MNSYASIVSFVNHAEQSHKHPFKSDHARLTWRDKMINDLMEIEGVEKPREISSVMVRLELPVLDLDIEEVSLVAENEEDKINSTSGKFGQTVLISLILDAGDKYSNRKTLEVELTHQVEGLLLQGANPLVEDGQEKNAIDRAREEGYGFIVTLLQKHCMKKK